MEEPGKLEPWIETYTGKQMRFLDPTPDMIDLEDISHSLSLQCRFAGHTKKFYSVAEHSYRVGVWLWEKFDNDPELALQGMLHDASEAYLIDIPSPVKAFITNYGQIEDALMSKISTKFGLTYPFDRKIKLADMVMLKNEARHLMRSRGESWAHKFDTGEYEYNASPYCMSPEDAKKTFVLHFNYFKEKLNGKEKKVNNGTSERDQKQQRKELLLGPPVRYLRGPSLAY